MTVVVSLLFFFFKQKTAYEMRISDWSSDVCSSDLGLLADYLHGADGGLKGVVQAERQLRREETGKLAKPADAVRAALADKLRGIEPVDFADIANPGSEFALVMIRRTAEGEVLVLGDVETDIELIEKSARKSTSLNYIQ